MESFPTTLPVIDELIGERIAWLALHDIGLGSLVGQRDGRHLSDGAQATRYILSHCLICHLSVQLKLPLRTVLIKSKLARKFASKSIGPIPDPRMSYKCNSSDQKLSPCPSDPAHRLERTHLCQRAHQSATRWAITRV